MTSSKKRMVFYGVVLVFLGLLALWVFHGQDDLEDLKRTERITEGLEAPTALVENAVKAIDKKDRHALLPLMASRDGVQFGRITELVFMDQAMSPIEILGARRLKNSSAPDRISLYARSQGRDKLYLFHLRKGQRGGYRIDDIELTDRGPEPQSND